MGELRDSLTNTQLVYYMAFMKMYPMGDEAQDVRIGAVLAKLDGGIGTVQLKRGKTSKIRPLFNREFWTKPHSLSGLKNKIMAAFRGLGMEGED